MPMAAAEGRRTSISPPPSKRRRLDEEPSSSTATELVVYSWNVNGIDALLQVPITAFIDSRAVCSSRPATTALPPIRAFLARHAWPQVCCLQEVKIAPTDTRRVAAVKRAVSNRANPALPDYDAHFCLPAEDRFATAKGAGRHYGVCTLVRSDYARQAVRTVRSVDWDNEGRILILETAASESRPKLAIVNVYLVNGTNLPYRRVVGAEVRGTRHDRKLQVHALLQAECARMQADGFSVILAGDMNIARSPLDGHPRLRTHPVQHNINRADFEHRFLTAAETVDNIDTRSEDSSCQVSQSIPEGLSYLAEDGKAEPRIELKVPEPSGSLDGSASTPREKSGIPTRSLGMHDTFRKLHQTAREYSYFSRAANFGESCDRVDMVIVSDDTISFCTRAGMHATPADRATSDHVPIFAVFDWDMRPGTEAVTVPIETEEEELL